MKYYNLLCAVLSILAIFFHSMCMEMPNISEKFLIQLQGDAKIKDFNYKPDYFKPIATKIHNIYAVLENNPEEYYRLGSLLGQYEQQLKFHAQKYIQQLIKDPYYSEQQKKELLQTSFPKSDTTLAEYLYQGLEIIKAQEKSHMQAIFLQERLIEEKKKNIYLI